jgi:glutathione S-transferase
LIDGNELVTETAAIALYLTDKQPGLDLSISAGDPRRGSYLSWLAFYAGEVEPAFARKVAAPQREDSSTELRFSRVVRRVTTALEKGPYLLGEQFTAADILVSGPFEWFSEIVPDNSFVSVWLKKLRARDAVRRWLHKEDWPASVGADQKYDD